MYYTAGHTNKDLTLCPLSAMASTTGMKAIVMEGVESGM